MPSPLLLSAERPPPEKRFGHIIDRDIGNGTTIRQKIVPEANICFVVFALK